MNFRNNSIMIDGSEMTEKSSLAVGYGLMLNGTEHFGSMLLKKTHATKGLQEYIAFLEACCLADKLQISASSLILYTDDLTLSRANSLIAKGYYSDVIGSALVSKLSKACEVYNKKGLLELAFHYMENALILKIKSHASIIEQERVDYLAKYAARTQLNEPQFPFLSWEDWLKNGIPYWDKELDQTVRKEVPFKNLLII